MIYAGFWKRAVAFIIDALVIWVIMAILYAIAFFPQILAFLLGGFYHVVFETSPLRATPGKALMKMAVTKADGRRLTIRDSIVRYVLSWVSGMFLCLGYFISIFTEKKQTFHDMIADTIVIEETFGQYNLWQVFINQCKVLFGTNTNSNPPYEKNVDSKSLEELYGLYQKGILTEEEYRNKKEEYLKKF